MSAVKETAVLIRSNMIAQLSKPYVYVSLAVDAATYTNHDKIYNLMLVHAGSASYWKSVNVQSKFESVALVCT